jgi:uncharacterized protein
MTAARNALIVFGKLPATGRVKTRLAAVLGERLATDLYAAFLADTLHALSSVAATLQFHVPPDDGEPPAGLLPAGVDVRRQRGRDLGERLLAAFVDAFAAGFERVVVVGSDHPTLPAAFADLAFAELRQRGRVVLGPSGDGGYYLVGANDLYPRLFAGMRYSHASVFAETVERAGETDAGLTILPAWYDVDTVDDLARLQADLAADAALAPRTREVMANAGISGHRES